VSGVDREIRFVSSNEFKIAEARAILEASGVAVVPLAYKIEELQTEDALRLVRDKALKAFDITRAPVFVEHTGLELNHLNGFPGGLTQIFWDTLEADRFAELFGMTPDPSVLARTTVGYIDGRKFMSFEGECSGVIVRPPPRGDRGFQWDCVFQPDDHNETFAEMGTIKKNEISMRRRALDELAAYLRTET
jgi:XTP/dITP diphosphohydrolase